jgi:hypothetical protein
VENHGRERKMKLHHIITLLLLVAIIFDVLIFRNTEIITGHILRSTAMQTMLIIFIIIIEIRDIKKQIQSKYEELLKEIKK